MVRAYILTEREREIIVKYLNDGLMLEGFRELKHLLSYMDLERIERDKDLVKAFRVKIGLSD